MKVASGNVTDRPFARTVYSLASKQFTGDLIMQHKRRETKVVWSEGTIVAAQSASPADTLGRQALTHGLVNSSTLGMFVQKLAENPDQDELGLLKELAKLNDEQCKTLKHHVLVRSAARMFALADATFVVDNQPSIAADPDLPALDVRWLIYFGLRTHYSLDRLNLELKALGDRRISLGPKAEPLLPAFGFGEYEAHVIARLKARPMTLADLLSSGLDANIAGCVVYALVACGYVEFNAEAATDEAAAPPPAVAVPAPEKPITRLKRASMTSNFAPRSGLVATTMRGVGFVEPEAPVDEKQSADVETTIALVREKVRVLDSGGNHYEVLGLEAGASDSDVRKSYFQLARRLHPDRLQSLGVTKMVDEIQRSFAAINDAFKVLSNPKELAEYKKVLAAGGKKAYEKQQAEAEEMAANIFQAEEHFHLGEMALRRDQYATAERQFAKAIELQPNESEYQALHVWAWYCNADDRPSIESEAMSRMSSAILKSSKSVTTRLYHAKLLKLMGRRTEAITSFKKLLEMSPGHHEAELELRVLEQSEDSSISKKTKKGFFGR